MVPASVGGVASREGVRQGVQDRCGVAGLFRQGVAVLRFVGLALPTEVRRVAPEAGQPGYESPASALESATR